MGRTLASINDKGVPNALSVRRLGIRNTHINNYGRNTYYEWEEVDFQRQSYSARVKRV